MRYQQVRCCLTIAEVSTSGSRAGSTEKRDDIWQTPLHLCRQGRKNGRKRAKYYFRKKFGDPIRRFSRLLVHNTNGRYIVRMIIDRE